MELTLNLVWLGFAGLLLALWAMPNLAHAKNQRTVAALLALLCVICVLFPVVSMTDDLNTNQVDPESVKSKLTLAPQFLIASSAWVLVYDAYATAFNHEMSAQPEHCPPVHTFLSFLLARRPPPQLVET